MRILALDHTGLPNRWISLDKAMFYHAKDLVAWQAGDVIETYHGGDRRVDGTRSILTTSSIIAIKNRKDTGKYKPPQRITLTNQSLFNRDANLCAYCGQVHNTAQLSRDHITPIFLGGKDIWTNVVTACKWCNGQKGHKTIKELGWKLLYVPYVPSFYESMILRNRNILDDQMEFLLAKVSRESRVYKNFYLTKAA